MIYLISDGKHTKIGWSKNPEKRLRQLQTGNNDKLKICHLYHDAPRVKERLLHRLLGQFRLNNSEWFALSPQDAKMISDKILGC